MVRNLYFTWDPLTGPYLNAHSLLDCSTGRSVVMAVFGGEWFCIQNRASVYNQADSRSSISSIKSWITFELQCNHNTNQNCNISEMFRNHGFGSPLDIVWTFWMAIVFSKQNGVPRLTSQLWPLQNLRRWLRNDELTGEFVKDRFWKSMRRVSHGEWITLEVGWFSKLVFWE